MENLLLSFVLFDFFEKIPVDKPNKIRRHFFPKTTVKFEMKYIFICKYTCMLTMIT